MNKVLITGIIAGDPAFRILDDGTPNLRIKLGVQHRTKTGERRREYYRVNAWNGTANWADKNLKKGQLITIQGYLSQRKFSINGVSGNATEITADEFTIAHFSIEKDPLEDNNPTPTANENPVNL